MKEEKLVAGHKLMSDTKINWPTDSRSQYKFDFDLYSRIGEMKFFYYIADYRIRSRLAD
jgi:hypothetical protein